MVLILERTRVLVYREEWFQLHATVLWKCRNDPVLSQINSAGQGPHYYSDVIMGAIASQITSLMTVYSIVYSDADQRKHQSSASLAFVRRIQRGPVNSPHKWPVTRKIFPFADVIILTQRPLVHHHTYYHYCHCYRHCHLDGLVQERCSSMANALELRLSCTNPSIFCNDKKLPWNLLFIRQTIIYGPKGFSYLFNRYNPSPNISLKNRRVSTCKSWRHLSCSITEYVMCLLGYHWKVSQQEQSWWLCGRLEHRMKYRILTQLT